MKKITISFLIVFQLSIVFGQGFKRIQTIYNSGDYRKVVELMEQKQSKKGELSNKELLLLGNSQYRLEAYRKAAISYGVLSRRSYNFDYRTLLNYYHCEKKEGSMEKSDSLFRRCNEKRAHAVSIENYKEWEVKDVDSNHGILLHQSSYEIFYLSDVNNYDVWLTTNERIGFLEKKDKYTSGNYLQIYKGTLQRDSLVYDHQQIKELKSAYHYADAVISSNGEHMFFVSSNEKTSDNNRINLKIFSADLRDGTWENIQPLDFCLDAYSYAHPRLSADESELYFVSNLKGSFGGSDIYKVKLEYLDPVGKPQNLGPMINTPGNESFPFIDSNNMLYFSSDGHYGYGGFDLFRCDLNQKPTQKVHNLGPNMNTKYDEIAYLFSQNLEYITRSKAMLESELWRFGEYPEEKVHFQLMVNDIEGNSIAEGIQYSIVDVDGNRIELDIAETQNTLDFVYKESYKFLQLKDELGRFETKKIPLTPDVLAMDGFMITMNSNQNVVSETPIDSAIYKDHQNALERWIELPLEVYDKNGNSILDGLTFYTVNTAGISEYATIKDSLDKWYVQVDSSDAYLKIQDEQNRFDTKMISLSDNDNENNDLMIHLDSKSMLSSVDGSVKEIDPSGDNQNVGGEWKGDANNGNMSVFTNGSTSIVVTANTLPDNNDSQRDKPKGESTKMDTTSQSTADNSTIELYTETKIQNVNQAIELNATSKNMEVLFDYDSFHLSSEKLHQILGFIADLPEGAFIIQVDGYTDCSGPEWYNKKLSLQRAQSVADFLIKNGVNPNRIKVHGNGEIFMPSCGNYTIEELGKYRKVVLRIVR